MDSTVFVIIIGVVVCVIGVWHFNGFLYDLLQSSDAQARLVYESELTDSFFKKVRESNSVSRNDEIDFVESRKLKETIQGMYSMDDMNTVDMSIRYGEVSNVTMTLHTVEYISNLYYDTSARVTSIRPPQIVYGSSTFNVFGQITYRGTIYSFSAEAVNIIKNGDESNWRSILISIAGKPVSQTQKLAILYKVIQAMEKSSILV